MMAAILLPNCTPQHIFLSHGLPNKKALKTPPSPFLVSLQDDAIKAIIYHSTDGKSSDFLSSVEPEKRIAYLHISSNSFVIFVSSAILFLYITCLYFHTQKMLLPAFCEYLYYWYKLQQVCSIVVLYYIYIL